MEKIAEKSGAAALPDVSEENDYRENIASAFATNQFGRKQTMGENRLQAGKNGGLKSASHQAAGETRRRRRQGWIENVWRSSGHASHGPRQTNTGEIRLGTSGEFSTARDRHGADQDGAGLLGAANQNIIADSDDVFEHISEITRNRNFLDRVLDHASLHPIA